MNSVVLHNGVSFFYFRSPLCKPETNREGIVERHTIMGFIEKEALDLKKKEMLCRQKLHK